MTTPSPIPADDPFPRLAVPDEAPAPAPPPPDETKEERGFVAPAASTRGAQVALVVFLTVLVGLLAFRGYGGRIGARPTEPVAGPALVDLNTAGEAELAQVPGVGPKLAAEIVAHRRANGPFRSVEELKNVRGVGAVTFDKVRPHVRVGPVPPRSEEVTAHYPPAVQPATVQPPTGPPATARPAQPGARKVQPGDPPINVNTATAEELQRLPGVGPVTAQNIIAARTVAPFRSVDDLDRAKGIGPKTLDKLRPYVVVK